MATEDGRDAQRAEKITLKRKLTGPPRLLLGKTRTRSVGDDRPETRAQTDKTVNVSRDESSAAAESATAELTETANMDGEVSSEVNTEGSRGRCGAAGEDDDSRNRKVNRCRWWKRFSPAAICIWKQKKAVEESLDVICVPPEGALPESDPLNNVEEKPERVTDGRRGFYVRTWPTFKRLLTSSNVQRAHEQKRHFVEKDGDKPSMTFRKKLRKFFTRKGKNTSPGVPLENMEDTMKCEEAPCSSVAQVDEPTELHDDITDGQEVVTVSAEMSVQLTEDGGETPPEEQLHVDIKESTDGSETIQTHSEVSEAPAYTNNVPEKDEVFGDSAKVVLDPDDQLSASTKLSEDETTLRSFQPTTNGPSIRIELVPPGDVAQEDREEECWEGGSSSENQNHLLLLLLGFEHSERQLVQTARSLVRVALNAAVDQLTREQQSSPDSVYREPQGYRDHA